MKKLNTVIYNKIILQAEQARELGMEKLSEAIFSTIGAVSKDDSEIDDYSLAKLEDDVSKLLWKISYRIMDYYNLESVDVKKVEASVDDLTLLIMDELKYAMNIEKTISKKEPRVMGQE